MENLQLVFPEIFLSLSIMFLLILGVYKKDSSKLIQNISLIILISKLNFWKQMFRFSKINSFKMRISSSEYL